MQITRILSAAIVGAVLLAMPSSAEARGLGWLLFGGDAGHLSETEFLMYSMMLNGHGHGHGHGHYYPMPMPTTPAVMPYPGMYGGGGFANNPLLPFMIGQDLNHRSMRAFALGFMYGRNSCDDFFVSPSASTCGGFFR